MERRQSDVPQGRNSNNNNNPPIEKLLPCKSHNLLFIFRKECPIRMGDKCIISIMGTSTDSNQLDKQKVYTMGQC